jgi:hypothetical protein
VARAAIGNLAERGTRFVKKSEPLLKEYTARFAET